MPVRVVVTSKGPDGVSRVDRDSPATAAISLETVGGIELAYPLQVRVPPADLYEGDDPADGVGPLAPPPGWLNFFQLTVPPGYPTPLDTEEQQAVVAELRAKLPGMIAMGAPERGRGMHATPTIDLISVSAGKVLLRLDDGSATELRPGDCVVQRGAMHAWANPFDEPCILTGVMLATV
jgi:hypothetical protein